MNNVKENAPIGSRFAVIADEEKPDLPRWLFWDFRYDDIEWREEYVTVIERVIDFGFDEDWNEMIRFYGYDQVVHLLKFKSIYLKDYRIQKACDYFNLKPEELWCYWRKRLRGGHWL